MKHYHLEDIYRDLLITNSYWKKANLVLESEEMEKSIQAAGGDPEAYKEIKAKKQKAAAKPKVSPKVIQKRLDQLSTMRDEAEAAEAAGVKDPLDRPLIKNPHTNADARAALVAQDEAMKKAAASRRAGNIRKEILSRKNPSKKS